MDQVVGIETVVAQVVGEQFAGGEIVRMAEPFGQFADSNPQGSFAERIALRAVAEVAHRADREDDFFVGQRPGEELRPFGCDFFDREPCTVEKRLRLLVAVGDDAAALLEPVDPRRAESDDKTAGGGQEPAQAVERVVVTPENRGRVGAAQQSVGVVVEPPAVGVLPKLGEGGGRGVLHAVQQSGDRRGVEERPREVALGAKLQLLHPAAHFVGEARAEQQHGVGVAEPETQRRDVDFGAEFHGAKVGEIRPKIFNF